MLACDSVNQTNGLMLQSDASLAQKHDDITHRLASMQLLLDEQQQKHTIALAQQAANFVTETLLREEARQREKQAINNCVICLDAPRTLKLQHHFYIVFIK